MEEVDARCATDVDVSKCLFLRSSRAKHSEGGHNEIGTSDSSKVSDDKTRLWCHRLLRHGLCCKPLYARVTLHAG